MHSNNAAEETLKHFKSKKWKTKFKKFMNDMETRGEVVSVETPVECTKEEDESFLTRKL